MKRSDVMTKIVHITTVDIGGAYKAVERLSRALNVSGKCESSILLRNKLNASSDGEVFLNSALKSTISKLKNGINLLATHGEISRDILASDVTNHRLVKEADIIVVHWINSFLNEKSIGLLFELNKPVYIMLHDMWHFTGGCHSDGYCGGFERGCITCPHTKLCSSVASANLKRKIELYAGQDVTVVAPSRYEAEEAKKSPVFCDTRVVTIGNCIDVEIFKPADSTDVIKKYGIPQDKPLVLFSSVIAGKNNKNKGFDYLLSALEQLDKAEVHLLILGSTDEESVSRIRQSYTRLGYVNSEIELAKLYSMADVTVVPSLQESFSYSVCESLACGTPTVSFAVGGIKDQVEHLKNGYLAEYKNSTDLAKGIKYCIENKKSMSEECRLRAMRFGYDKIARKWDSVISPEEI